jgi:hypothetical protein
VEENAATAKVLDHQARSMDEQVAFFRVDAEDVAGEAAPVRYREVSRVSARTR